MSDARSLPPTMVATRARGLRIGVVSVMVAIAFLLGLGLALLLVKRQLARDAVTPAAPALAQPVASVPAGMPAPPVSTIDDAATLTAREAALAGQIAALEARADALTAGAQAAGSQAYRAEALLAAVAARRAIDRGVGLGALDGQLVQRFGSTRPNAVAIVRTAGRQPVTLEELRQGLDAIGPVAATEFGNGWWAAVRREIGQLVVMRRAGTPSPRPMDRLARARRLLAADQVEAARAEVLQLPGAADAGNWLAAARRYALARQALDVLETAALTAPATITPTAAPAVINPLLPATTPPG